MKTTVTTRTETPPKGTLPPPKPLRRPGVYKDGIPPDPVVLVESLDLTAINNRIAELCAQTRALEALKKVAEARENAKSQAPNQ